MLTLRLHKFLVRLTHSCRQMSLNTVESYGDPVVLAEYFTKACHTHVKKVSQPELVTLLLYTHLDTFYRAIKDFEALVSGEDYAKTHEFPLP